MKAVKRVLFDTKSRTLNRKVARAIYSSTESAELWYPVEKPTKNYGFDSTHKLRVAIFSPLFGDRLYPYFDETGDMVAFSREYVVKDSAGVNIPISKPIPIPKYGNGRLPATNGSYWTATPRRTK